MQRHYIRALEQKVDDDPGTIHIRNLFLNSMQNSQQIIILIFLTKNQMEAFSTSTAKAWLRLCQEPNIDGDGGGKEEGAEQKHPFSLRCKAEPALAKAEEHQQRRRKAHGGAHGGELAHTPPQLIRFRQRHAQGILHGHEQVHAEGVDEQEHQHRAKGGREQAQHRQP